MDQAAEYENMQGMPGPSRETVTYSAFIHEGTNIVESKNHTQSQKIKTGTEETMSPNAKEEKSKNVTMLETKKPKTETRPATTRMVNKMMMDSIVSLKNQNGSTLEDISNYLEENYHINMKLFEPSAKAFLKRKADTGVLEKIVEAAGDEERFKIKTSEALRKGSSKSISKDGEARNSEGASETENKGLKRKRITFSSSTATGMMEAAESGKRTRNMKDAAEVKKQKVAPSFKSKNLKKKAAHPPTSEMVTESIKALKKRNGATFEDISQHIEEAYQVNMKVLKAHVNKFLKKGVDTEVLDETDGVDAKKRYKIKKPKNAKENSKDSSQKKRKGKSAPKKLVARKSKNKNKTA